ncbi:hypothetical protein V1478_012706 [Vespula squamosa]|uniref:Uncharacterized protein n=1 Tax=Vespula squamosa TaxID=30214 RepID=A0ABD2A9C9_VESSQ
MDLALRRNTFKLRRLKSHASIFEVIARPQGVSYAITIDTPLCFAKVLCKNPIKSILTFH